MLIQVDYDFANLTEEQFENLNEEELEELQSFLDFQEEYLENIAIGNGDFYYNDNGDIIIED